MTELQRIYNKKDATKNVKSLDDLEYIGFLCYEEKVSARKT